MRLVTLHVSIIGLPFKGTWEEISEPNSMISYSQKMCTDVPRQTSGPVYKVQHNLT